MTLKKNETCTARKTEVLSRVEGTVFTSTLESLMAQSKFKQFNISIKKRCIVVWYYAKGKVISEKAPTLAEALRKIQVNTL